MQTQDYKLPRMPDPEQGPILMPKQDLFARGFLSDQGGVPGAVPPGETMGSIVRRQMGIGARQGGVSSLLSSLLGSGGPTNQPVGMPTPVAPPAGGASPAIGGGGLRPSGGGGLSPALSGVLTGTESGGGDVSNIQALLAQLLKRKDASGPMGGSPY